MGHRLLRRGHHRHHAEVELSRPGSDTVSVNTPDLQVVAAPSGAAMALSMRHVDKAFDGRPALRGASLDVRWGEVHALLGENGAGKSTLMNVLCGLYSADRGEVMVDGQPALVHGPPDAMALGIGMVHQHFKLVDSFTVAENVLLACAGPLGLRQPAQAAERLRKAADDLGFEVHPDERTDRLSIAERQRVEILKLVMLGARILILDEPTAVLTDAEADAVLAMLADMAARGHAVVLITHRLREVAGHADRVTIMRGGETVLSGAALSGDDGRAMDETALATAMVGDDVASGSAQRLAPTGPPGEVRLSVRGLGVRRASGVPALEDIHLDVAAGEIVGIAGVGGNGQTELVESLYGLLPADHGTITLDATEATTLDVRGRRRLGLRIIPADRFDYALFGEMTAADNLALTGIPDGRFGPAAWVDRGAIRQFARSRFEIANVTGGTPGTRTRLLSGGNAQKLLLARELDNTAGVIIAHSPTRGLDVRACAAVHAALVACVRNGAACLLVSEDLDEILALSNRIGVLSRGRLTGPFDIAEVDRGRIGGLMAGHA